MNYDSTQSGVRAIQRSTVTSFGVRLSRSSLWPTAKFIDRLMRVVLFTAAAFSVVITISIASILIIEAIPFFAHVSLWRVVTESEWAPLFAEARYGIGPLICGTFVTTFVALAVAVPLGTISALYLSEYATPRVREVLKPILELLSSIPTVVYGYFALLMVTPVLQKILPELPGFNMLSAGLVMGCMIIPYVCSLGEDAMRAVPTYMREGSIAMGATRLQTALRVVIPAAFSGLTSAYILALARAVGETMIVAIAAGMQPGMTLNPLNPAQTMTAYIVQVSLGDLPHGSIGYQSIFVVGLFLMILTLIFNLIGQALRKRFREAY